MITKKLLNRLYWKERKSLNEIARILGCGSTNIFYWMNKYKIKRRSFSESLMGHLVTLKTRKKISKNHYNISGKSNPNWKNGRFITNDGYVKVYAPAHPNKVGNYMLEHRLIMEKYLGRYLTSNEVVNHKNRVKDDNKRKNLGLHLKREHDRLEAQRRKRDIKGRFI